MTADSAQAQKVCAPEFTPFCVEGQPPGFRRIKKAEQTNESQLDKQIIGLWTLEVCTGGEWPSTEALLGHDQNKIPIVYL
jgi:hypothetical protein